ncbi:MAG: argininosuccinate lyase [Rickettsiales bacterium]|nr:argininosuccinate lyase [Rickettsiales bacterium]|tara:strand:+ start:3002 stop:4396 length:1395 start_codon:yes stop_codon:yes gene_type:complete
MKNKKLWGGRFKQELDEDAKALSYSLDIDKYLVHYDIAVNLAHAKALNKINLLTDSEFNTISDCLNSLNKDFEQNPDYGLADDEDIHSAIERLVTEKCGDVGKKMHAGKSRNDQVITDVRLFALNGLDIIIEELQGLIAALIELAEKNLSIPFPGMTHFQPAQPVLFSHHMLAYCEKFKRDLNRFIYAFDATDVCPLGSGALAGNNYKLDRKLIADELGFSKISANSLDAVSDRDFICDILAASSQCMVHLSRFCEEIIVWNSPLLGFISLSDAFTTGSSIMPQKKNPDIAELIRGKCGRVQGSYIALQNTLKGLPLAYNRDLQEDKEHLFDAIETITTSLVCFKKMVAGIELNKDAISSALSKGYLTATELADYLVLKGVPFREAHEITGKVILEAIDSKKQLEDLSLADFQKYHSLIENDVFDALTINAAIKAKDIFGGTAPNQVKEQLKLLKTEMASLLNE